MIPCYNIQNNVKIAHFESNFHRAYRKYYSFIYSISMNKLKKNQKNPNQKIKDGSQTIVTHLENEKILFNKDYKSSNINYDLGHIYGSW